MSSDTATSSEGAKQCQWPGCPAAFTGPGPDAPGWRHILLAPRLGVLLCPFHATDHLPRVVAHGPGFRGSCSCGEMRVSMPRTGVTAAAQDWRVHAREVNGPDARDVCPECLRDFEPRDDGMVRPHNALDRARGVLLSTLCHGVGKPPRSQVAR